MKCTGQFLFDASPDSVWAAIYNPAMLKACIPQCESITPLTPTTWQGVAKVKIGFLPIRFTGDITLSELNPPHSYIIAMVAHGFVGTADGVAHVRLEPAAEGTVLHYEAEVKIGIKMLNKALNLASGLAEELATHFFERLNTLIQQQRRGDISPQ